MPLERSRQLISGVWRYVSAEQSDGGNGGSQTVLSATVALDNADILALTSTPVELIAAPGAGKMIFPIAALVVCDTTAGVYTNFGDSAFLSFVYDAGASAYTVLASISQLVGGGVSNVLAAGAVSGTAVGIQAAVAPSDPPSVFPSATVGDAHAQDPAGWEDKPLLLYGDNAATGGFEDGNAANTLTITVLYALLDV